MFYVFQSNGAKHVMAVEGAVVKSESTISSLGLTIPNAPRVRVGKSVYEIDPGTAVELLTAEQAQKHLPGVQQGPTYEEALAESAVEFFDGSPFGMTVIAAANEKFPDNFKARLAYILAASK